MKALTYILFFAILFNFDTTYCFSQKSATNFELSNNSSLQFLELAKNNFPDSIEKAIYYSKLGLEKSRVEHNEKNETQFLDILGKYYYVSGNKEEALVYLRTVRAKYEEQKDANNLSNTLNRIGSIYKEWGLLDEAMRFFVKALKIAENSNVIICQERIAQSCNNIGLLYKDLQEYDKAYEYCFRALNYYKKTNNQKLIAYTLNNLGLIHKWLKQYDKAISYFNESLSIKKELNDKISIANNIGNIGDVYSLLKKYDLALKYYNDALTIMLKNDEDYGIATTKLNIALVYINQNNPNNSLELLSNALLIAKKNNLKDLEKEIYKAFSQAYEKMNNDKLALNYFQKYSNLKDSIFNENNSKSIFKIDIAYNSEKIEKENENLRLKSQIKDEELFKQMSVKYALMLILAIIFFIGLLIFARSKIMQKSRKLLEEKNHQIEHINEELVSVNEELDNRVKERTLELEKEINEKENVITEVKYAYKKAEEANLLKDAFLANINHEIRTPLSAIIGLSEVLQNKITKSKDLNISKYVEGINQSGQRLLSLLNNILDISRIEANDFKINMIECDSNKIINQALDLSIFTINEKGLKLTRNASETPNIVADKEILVKVIADIINNSIKYTTKGEIIVENGFNKSSNEVYIKITDTGIGIDESYLPHVFETFRQESIGYARLYQGAGLGLPLAYRLLKLMNGKIEISSKKNSGTTVTIFISSSQNNSNLNENISYNSTIIPNDELLNKKHDILLVEDDKFNSLFLQTILESIGDVSVANDGNEALQIVKNKYNQNKVFDIVILDINLPENWEGIGLKNEIIKFYNKYNNVPFIAQSAYSQKSDKQRILNEGFIEFLTKPVDSEKLLNTIKNVLVKK